MSTKTIVTMAIVFIALIAGIVIFTSALGVCDAQEWIVVQPLVGKVRIQDNPGPYWKGFAKTWPYDRYLTLEYNADPKRGDERDGRIRTTFVDGGTAKHDVFVRIGTPVENAERQDFHEQFGGNIANIKTSVKAHLTNCLKASAPLMSGSEHQSARKAEFANIAKL